MRLAPAWITRTIIDEAVATGTFKDLLWLVAGLFAVTGVAKALNSLQNYLTEWLGQNVVHDLRNDLYRHLQAQSMSFFDANQTGQLMSRVTSDVSQVQSFVASGTIRILDAAVGIVIYLVVLLALDVQMTLVALAALPVIVFCQVRIRRITRIYRELQRMMGRLTGILQENVASIKLVKAYGREAHESQRFLTQYWQIRTKRMDTTRLMGAWSQAQEVSTALAATLVLFVGAQRVMEVAQRLQDPRFASPVLDVGQAGKECVAGRAVGRQRRPHVLELRPAIGVLDAVLLLLEDLRPRRHFPYGELEGERDVVGLGQGESGNGLGLPPHALEPRERRRRARDVAQRVEPGRLQAG